SKLNTIRRRCRSNNRRMPEERTARGALAAEKRSRTAALCATFTEEARQMAEQREWSTKFFPEELMTVDSSAVAADWTTDWTGKGKVLWKRGTEKNELNPRLNPNTLPQPETIDSKQDANDKVTWTLFVPSAVLASAKASKPLDPIPVTLLLGRGDEELGYGLRVFFERAGKGALLCLSGREGGDPGGRW